MLSGSMCSGESFIVWYHMNLSMYATLYPFMPALRNRVKSPPKGDAS